METSSIDDYIKANPEHIPAAIIIDEPSYEARIVQGAARCLAIHKPELITNCFTHGAYARGAPVIGLLRMLDELGYSMEIGHWNDVRADFKPLTEIVEPQCDVFLLYGVARTELPDRNGHRTPIVRCLKTEGAPRRNEHQAGARPASAILWRLMERGTFAERSCIGSIRRE